MCRTLHSKASSLAYNARQTATNETASRHFLETTYSRSGALESGKRNSDTSFRPTPHHTTMTSIGDPPHPNDEVAGAFFDLLRSLKVIANDCCNAHPDVSRCACDVALEGLQIKEANNIKRDRFIYPFDLFILGEKNAWCYVGTQESHHEFEYEHGMRPKEFMLEFLMRDVTQEFFVPAGRKKDTLQAMVTFWAERSKYWHQRHANQEEARAQYKIDSGPGGVMASQTLCSQEIFLWPHGESDTSESCFLEVVSDRPVDVDGLTVLSLYIVEITYCHPACPVARETIKSELPLIARNVARRMGVHGLVAFYDRQSPPGMKMDTLLVV